MKPRGFCFKCLNSCSCLLMMLKYHRKAVPVFGRSVMATRVVSSACSDFGLRADVQQSSESVPANVSGCVL